MRRIVLSTLLIPIILFVLTGCTSQAETPLPTRAALAEIETSVTAVAADETISPTAEPITAVTTGVSAIETEERPLLPNLASVPADTGPGAGLGGNITIAEGGGAADTSMLAPDAANLFAQTTFSLDTDMPSGITEAQVWQQSAMPLDENRATTIANRWGFSGPLYQFATPDERILDQPVSPESAQLPAGLPEYHLFDGARSLVVTEGAAYYADDSVAFDFETVRSLSERATAAEAELQAMGLLDFPYEIADGWGHEVWFNRVLDGMETNFPEISAGVAENGRLAFASYQPLDALTLVGTYPLISAEAAWQQIQEGDTENIQFSITPSDEPTDLLEPELTGFKYWPREHKSGQEVHLYTLPTVFLPLDEGLPPVIQALNYNVQADDNTLHALADQLGVNVHFQGILDTSTQSLNLTDWEPLTELNPLIKNGTIQRQGEQMLLVDQSGGTFILPDAPADLENGSQVNVFSWAARDSGQPYPILDWEGIDMQIPGSSGETMALPDALPPVPPVYDSISINESTLAYYVYPEFLEGENGRYQQSYWLLPVWQFTGTTDNGDVITLSVQASESVSQ